ncbi:MAG: PIN domain-containing protein [Thermoplasmata archaeon]|nr:PIN domain-containing protein [Thermoplasmata archaeon]
MPERIVVTDSGPLIHIAEVAAAFAWRIFPEVLVPRVVELEVKQGNRPGSGALKNDRLVSVQENRETQDRAADLETMYNLSPNDALVLSTAGNLHAAILLTDDLELRETAACEGIRPVGTIGMLLRAFRKRLCTLEKLSEKLDLLYEESTLYITKDLIEMVKRAAVQGQEEWD